MDALFSITSKLSKYLFLIPFVVFGVFHFLGADSMAEMVPIPGGAIWVYVTGVALIAAPVAAFMNHKLAKLALTLLGVMLLIFVFAVHLPMVTSGGDAGGAAMPSLLKDLALTGAAWMMASSYE